MNTNKNASASATEAPGADTSNENASTAGADAAGAEQTNSTKQEAPGGSDGEFASTWTLRGRNFFHTCVKVFFCAMAYAAFAATWSTLWAALSGLGFSIFFTFPLGVVLLLAFFTSYFSYALPAVCNTVDSVADKVVDAWTKVKTWFKKSEEAAAEPAPAAA